MEGASFKSILIFLLLAILAFVVGSLASEKAIDALVPIVLIAATFALVALGKHCWWLIFLAPPILGALQFSFLQSFPVAYAICGIVLVYWLLMSFLGYVRSTWNGVLLLDLISLVFVAYFLFTWVRHPVTIQAFTSITDFGYTDVGGREYFWCLGAILCYLAFSVIPISSDNLIKALKIVFWCSFCAALITCIRGFVSGGIVIDDAVTSRFGAFSGIGTQISHFILAKYSFIGIILSPWKFCLLCAGMAGIALGGFRSHLLGEIIFASLAAYFHRQFVVLLLLGLLAWGSVVLLSHEKVFDSFPLGMQRVVLAVPGAEITDVSLSRTAQHSLDWRYEMWEWAMDPSKGYIKDYMWGDGFALSQYRARLDQVAIGLGLSQWGDNTRFAKNGVWHSGYITTIHRIGYVGLVLVSSWFWFFLVALFKVGNSLHHKKDKEYAYVFLLTFVQGIVLFFYSAGTYTKFFASLFYTGMLIKLFYSVLSKEKLLKPMFVRERYVPQQLSEIENGGFKVVEKKA